MYNTINARLIINNIQSNIQNKLPTLLYIILYNIIYINTSIQYFDIIFVLNFMISNNLIHINQKHYFTLKKKN